eukprot:12420584-Karenia_brevis.AAC.1
MGGLGIFFIIIIIIISIIVIIHVSACYSHKDFLRGWSFIPLMINTCANWLADYSHDGTQTASHMRKGAGELYTLPDLPPT